MLPAQNAQTMNIFQYHPSKPNFDYAQLRKIWKSTTYSMVGNKITYNFYHKILHYWNVVVTLIFSKLYKTWQRDIHNNIPVQ